MWKFNPAILSGLALVSTAPMTYAGWVVPDSFLLTNTTVFNTSDTGANTNQIDFRLRRDPGDATRALVQARYAGATAQATATIGLGEMSHIAAVYVSDTERHSYVNGGNKGTSTALATASGGTNFRIGANALGGTGLQSTLGVLGVWDVALNDDEILALASGARPNRIRTPNCKYYFLLEGVVGATAPSYAGPGVANLAVLVAPTAIFNLRPPVGPFVFEMNERSRYALRGLRTTIKSNSRLDSLVTSTPRLKAGVGSSPRIKTQVGVAGRKG